MGDLAAAVTPQKILLKKNRARKAMGKKIEQVLFTIIIWIFLCLRKSLPQTIAHPPTLSKKKNGQKLILAPRSAWVLFPQ